MAPFISNAERAWECGPRATSLIGRKPPVTSALMLLVKCFQFTFLNLE